MAQFEELQQLWQRQQLLLTLQREAAALSDAFRRYGWRHDLIYLGKLIVVAGQLILLLSLLHHPLAVFGACLADFSAILFLISDWRAQRAIARLNFAAPSVQFLRSAIARLQAQRNPLQTREFYISMGGFWIGCTLMIANMQPQMTLSLALPAYALVTAMIFAAYALSRWVRRKRFEKQCRPLILRLEAVLQTMETDRV